MSSVIIFFSFSFLFLIQHNCVGWVQSRSCSAHTSILWPGQYWSLSAIFLLSRVFFPPHTVDHTSERKWKIRSEHSNLKERNVCNELRCIIYTEPNLPFYFILFCSIVFTVVGAFNLTSPSASIPGIDQGVLGVTVTLPLPYVKFVSSSLCLGCTKCSSQQGQFAARVTQQAGEHNRIYLVFLFFFFLGAAYILIQTWHEDKRKIEEEKTLLNSVLCLWGSSCVGLLCCVILL